MTQRVGPRSPTLYPSEVRSRSAGLDWHRADLPGATMPTPCREHQRRTRAPAESPRRAPVGGFAPRAPVQGLINVAVARLDWRWIDDGRGWLVCRHRLGNGATSRLPAQC